MLSRRAGLSAIAGLSCLRLLTFVSLHFSDGFTLSCRELNTIVLFLATDRQTCEIKVNIIVLVTISFYK